MTDPRLFDDAPMPGDPSMIPNTMPPSRRGAPHTSRDAARMVAAHTPNMRERVLVLIRSRGPAGATDDEGERALNMRVQTYTARRRELVLAGAVVDSGNRRQTSSGCSAVVWVAVEFAGGGGA